MAATSVGPPSFMPRPDAISSTQAAAPNPIAASQPPRDSGAASAVSAIGAERDARCVQRSTPYVAPIASAEGRA